MELESAGAAFVGVVCDTYFDEEDWKTVFPPSSPPSFSNAEMGPLVLDLAAVAVAE